MLEQTETWIYTNQISSVSTIGRSASLTLTLRERFLCQVAQVRSHSTSHDHMLYQLRIFLKSVYPKLGEFNDE